MIAHRVAEPADLGQRPRLGRGLGGGVLGGRVGVVGVGILGPLDKGNHVARQHTLIYITLDYRAECRQRGPDGLWAETAFLVGGGLGLRGA